VYAHRGHRLRDDHHVRRRVRRDGGGQDANSRGGIEGGNNANPREKKIAQLQEFIRANFPPGTPFPPQATSRKKEVERLQTAELAEEQHPAARTLNSIMKRNSGRPPAGDSQRREGPYEGPEK